MKDAFEQYQGLEFHKLKPTSRSGNRCVAKGVEESTSPKLRLVSVGNSTATTTNTVGYHVKRYTCLYLNNYHVPKRRVQVSSVPAQARNHNDI